MTGARTAGHLFTWVEWLMGFPLGWTDSRIPNEELVAASWAREPDDLPRTTDDREHRRDRLTALGNALVPAIPAWLMARYRAATESGEERAA